MFAKDKSFWLTGDPALPYNHLAHLFGPFGMEMLMVSWSYVHD